MEATIANEIDKKITEVFSLFDHNENKTVDIREIGTILRFLGCVPTEQEVNEVISATEFQDSRGTIQLSKFLPHVNQILTERRMEPAPPEKLLEAFRAIDPEGKGYVSKEYLSKMMMEEGECFTQEEVDEMMTIAVEQETGNIPYEYYLNQLMYEEKNSLYEIARKFTEEAEQRLAKQKAKTFPTLIQREK